jgi:hypothetical protein
LANMLKCPKYGIGKFLEAISKLGFSFEISRRRSAGQEREAEDQPTGILRYVEDLRRGLNADIRLKDFFEMASNNVWRSRVES